MRVLLSIKPEYVEKIFAGTKKYEFRKSLFKRSDVTMVVVYASSPICRVVGEFHIDGILKDEVNRVWEQTQKYSGVTEDYFKSYFCCHKEATAIQIGNAKRYKSARLLSDYNVLQAPQSFCYIDD